MEVNYYNYMTKPEVWVPVHKIGKEKNETKQNTVIPYLKLLEPCEFCFQILGRSYCIFTIYYVIAAAGARAAVCNQTYELFLQ